MPSRSAASALKNSGGADSATSTSWRALTQSEDTYFYNRGRRARTASTGNGHAIQDEARELSLGSSPGIDLGRAAAGLVPDRS